MIDEYEESTTFEEINPELRERVMRDFINSFSAMLQSGIRMLCMGENLEGNALYVVCADQPLNFIQFLNIEMDDEGDIMTQTIEIRNEDFEELYGLVAPVVIENCESFEDFLNKAGIQVEPEE